MTKEKRKQLITALITEPTRARACEVVGIDPRTLYNYTHDAEFMQEYNEEVNKLTDNAINDLRVAILNSITELNNIVLNSDDENIKLKAIKIALDCMQYANKYENENKKEKQDRIFLDMF